MSSLPFLYKGVEWDKNTTFKRGQIVSCVNPQTNLLETFFCLKNVPASSIIQPYMSPKVWMYLSCIDCKKGLKGASLFGGLTDPTDTCTSHYKNGNIYINSSNGSIWKFLEKTWTLATPVRLKPNGIFSGQGNNILHNNNNSVENDLYIDLLNGSTYTYKYNQQQQQQLAWESSPSGHLKSNTIYSGSGSPSSSSINAISGDLFLDTSTSNLYKYNSSGSSSSSTNSTNTGQWIYAGSLRGSMGGQGAIGEQGILGNTGPSGFLGDTGIKGETGDVGSQSIFSGDTGLKGETGDVGMMGIIGNTGSQGSIGDQGPRGETGDKGSDGKQGNTGLKGDTGTVGLRGQQGFTGASGMDGADALDGAKGDTGAKGQAGSDGAKGATGDTGASGAMGSDGSTGATGMKGTTGNNNTSPRTSAIAIFNYPENTIMELNTRDALAPYTKIFMAVNPRAVLIRGNEWIGNIAIANGGIENIIVPTGTYKINYNFAMSWPDPASKILCTLFNYTENKAVRFSGSFVTNGGPTNCTVMATFTQETFLTLAFGATSTNNSINVTTKISGRIIVPSISFYRLF